MMPWNNTTNFYRLVTWIHLQKIMHPTYQIRMSHVHRIGQSCIYILKLTQIYPGVTIIDESVAIMNSYICYFRIHPSNALDDRTLDGTS